MAVKRRSATATLGFAILGPRCSRSAQVGVEELLEARERLVDDGRLRLRRFSTAWHFPESSLIARMTDESTPPSGPCGLGFAEGDTLFRPEGNCAIIHVWSSPFVWI